MRILCATIIFTMFVCGFVLQADGEEVILISTAEQFENIRKIATDEATFRLSADIELSPGWRPFVFKGKLDGAGYTISGLKDSLFLCIVDSVVCNLVIEGANLHKNKRAPFVGIFAREILRSTIENVRIVDSSIFVEIQLPDIVGVGGFAGILEDSVIRNIAVLDSQIEVEVAESEMKKSFFATGGLVGIASRTVAENCEANVNISSRGGATGGFIGKLTNSSRIESSRSFGVVQGKENVGGFVGIVSADGAPNNITNSAVLSPAVIGDTNVRRFAGLLEHEGINGCHAYLGMAIIAEGQLLHVVPNAYGADAADIRCFTPLHHCINTTDK